MDTRRIDDIAEELTARHHDRRAGGRVTDRWEGLDLETAYAAQDRLVELRCAAGDEVVGLKLGLTSEAKQRQMNVAEPITGRLTASMRGHGQIDTAVHIHPRIEPEIAFVMGSRLAGPGIGPREAMTAVETVHAAFEVIDSRYEGFSFTLPDVVADNASSALFLLSHTGVRPDSLDLAAEPVRLWTANELAAEATGAAVLGHPAHALAMAANALGVRGQAIEPGWIVLTGALTDAVPVLPGVTYRAEFGLLGDLVVTAS